MNTIYLQSPATLSFGDFNRFREFKSVFLAGSITNAANWQDGAVKKLLPRFNVVNPRRQNYIWNEEVEREQIAWEFNFLRTCDIILFHFGPETLAPISLFEYGKFLGREKTNHWQKAYVSIHPIYKRKNDILIQTELECPDLWKKISFDLNGTLDQIIAEN